MASQNHGKKSFIKEFLAVVIFLTASSLAYLSAQNLALNFTATTNAVIIGKPDQPLNAWTVEMWAKRSQATSHATILAGDKFKLNLETWGSGNKVGYTLVGQSAPDKAFNYILPLNTWVHVAYVYSDGKISLYANGELVGTQSFTVQLPLRSLGLSAESFIGVIDELRIWKTARTADELKNNMNQSVNPLTETDMLLYWYFDDKAATATDISSNGNAGIINGATYIANANPAFTTNLPQMNVKAVSCFHSNEYLVRPGDKKQEILGIKITTEGIVKPVSLAQLNLTLNGTTNAADVTSATVFSSGQLAQFSTTTPFGTTANGTALQFDGALQLQPGDNYLWLAVDVSGAAANGNLLDAAFVSAQIGSQTYTPSIPTPKGGRPVSTEITPVAAGNALSLIPKPMNFKTGNGSFTLNAETRIIISPSLEKEAAYLAEIIRNSTGYPVPVSVADANATTESNAIILTLSVALDATIGREGYVLLSTADRIIIEGKQPVGVFWGIQTLRQTLPPQIESKTAIAGQVWSIPAMSIADNPRFPYRGVMLDVSRHFFPVSTVKRTLDLMAMYKLNVFHWHLTDDQGWRVEIKKYPKLQEIAAWRTCDGIKTGGYYTQEEIKDIVAYATDRHIDIIPEIDLPGHMLAVLAAYPHLGCTSGSGSYSVTCNRGGIYADILCGGKEATYTFLKDVLTELIAIFPGKYIHIGGDEAVKSKWNSCTDCKAKIAELGITGASDTEKSNKLQKFMTEYFVQFLADNGRKLVGWDEIMHGGIPAGATIQVWNEAKAETKADAIQAVKNGQDIIMSDYYKLYLAQKQSDSPDEPAGPGLINTLDEFYNYEPVFPEIPADKVQHVLGAEGCLWTEWVETESHVEYMLSPRSQALAEMTWTPKAAKNYSDFLYRLNPHFERWNTIGYNFRWNVKPQTFTKKITTCEPELKLSAQQNGVSYFWNNATHSTSKTITVSESGVYKCYIDYYGQMAQETYEVEFTNNAALNSIVKTENTTDETITLAATNPAHVYKWYEINTLMQVGQSITLPKNADLNNYFIDANKLSNGISSVHLNATNGYVTLDAGEFMNNAAALTLETWVKVNTWKEWGAIFMRRQDSNLKRMMIELGVNGELYCHTSNGAAAYGKAPAGTLPTGVWTHLALVFDGAKTGNAERLKLYVNGNPVTLTFSGTIPNTLPTVAANLRLGRGENDLTPNIHVSEVRGWKTAISAQQITENMNGLRNAKISELQFYFPLEKLTEDASDMLNPFNLAQKAVPTGLAPGFVSKDTSPVQTLSCSSAQGKVSELLTGIPRINVDNTSLVVHPNPNKGVFFISLTDNSTSGGMLKIVNLQGQTIFTETLTERPVNKKMSLANVGAGIYFVHFKTNEDKKEFVCKLAIK